MGAPDDLKEIYRAIPGVDTLLREPRIRELSGVYGRAAVTAAVREELDRIREIIRQKNGADPSAADSGRIAKNVAERLRASSEPVFRKVINGTGTILHTNLGRAPLPREMSERLAGMLSGYSNLEYDLESGERSDRLRNLEKLLTTLTGAESAAVVNNNAAAVLTALSAAASGGETIISRGELVEIGGHFRIMDVSAQSGTVLKEVGTTNRTNPEDYRAAASPRTRAILKVHTSNYRIIGFTESVPVRELRVLADELGVPVIEDLGSGVMIGLERFGLSHEPTVREALEEGADIVCFSGDKLLGGPQAGVIAGRKKYVDLIRKHPLYRAVRADKYTAAAMELVLLEYLNEEKVCERIPVLRMLGETAGSVRERALRLAEMIEKTGFHGNIRVGEVLSQAGGGALPEEKLPSFGVLVRPLEMSVSDLEAELHRAEIPVIGRAAEGCFILDARTISEEELEGAAEAFAGLAARETER